MRRLLKMLMLIILALLISCDTTNPDEHKSTYDEITMILSKDKDTSLIGDTVSIECTYFINILPDEMKADTFVANGYFKTYSDWWKIVDGDSCWVDTIMYQETKTHSTSLIPLTKGNIFVHATVKVDLNLPGNSYLSKDGVIFLEVK